MSPAAVSADLLAAARAGDRDAIAHLLAVVQPDIRRYARRSCRNASDVDDAVQETLFLVYRRLGSLRLLGAFASWLFVMVDRICLRLARKALSRPNEVDLLEADPIFAARSDGDLRLDLAAAIESLPANLRDVLLLRDVDELTIDEIGIRLFASRQAVKARLHRARTLVREYLKR
jgi:RNA polymerase sigma-70 factor (ECF subfamily)